MWQSQYAPIPDGERSRQGGRRPRWAVAVASTAAAAGLLMAVLVVLASQERPERTAGMQSLAVSRTGNLAGAAVDSTAAPTFVTYNSYTKVTPITWFNDVEGAPKAWKHLAEPHRESTFTADAGQDGGGNAYSWSIDGSSYMGQSVTHTFTAVGNYNIVLQRVSLATGDVATLNDLVAVKYVRREIRSLSDEDRERLLDAIETMYRLPTSVGVNIYGPDYKGIEYMVQIHLDGAGVLDCDHWHDDAGIMSHHVGYTLQFEQALQVIDPSLAIPYWEYTLDQSLYGSAPASLAANSPIFQDDWFGEMSPANGLHTMTRGRWAYTPVAEDSWDQVHNPYGLLRAPWNTDPTPYLTRHDLVDGQTFFDVVSCEVYRTCFVSASLAEMNQCLNGGTHGPIHIIVGGSWGSPDQTFMQEAGFSDIHILAMKSLWRRGYVRMPETCTNEGVAATSSSAETATGCKASCPTGILTANNMTAYDALEDSQALYWTSVSSSKIYLDAATNKYRVLGLEDNEAATLAFWDRMLAALCDPGHVGEMYTPSAPYDPLFWVIHPSAERLLNARRMLGRASGTAGVGAFDETWGYAHKPWVAGDMGVVCDWSQVKTATDLPVCTSATCGGHSEKDILPFLLTIDGRANTKVSNADMMSMTYPTNDSLPYMYDNYDWEWCTSQGISINYKM